MRWRPLLVAAAMLALPTACVGPTSHKTVTVAPRAFKTPHPVTAEENERLDGYEALLNEMATALAGTTGQVSRSGVRRHFADLSPDRCYLESEPFYVAGRMTDTDADRAAIRSIADEVLQRHGFPRTRPDKAPDSASVALRAADSHDASLLLAGRGGVSVELRIPLPWSECA